MNQKQISDSNFSCNLKETLNILPKSLRRSVGYYIENQPLHDQPEETTVIRDFLEVALLTGITLTLLQFALQDTLALNIVSSIDPLLLTVILVSGGVIYSVTFFALAWGFLMLKGRNGLKLSLFYQPLKFYTSLHIPLTVLFIISVNASFTYTFENRYPHYTHVFIGLGAFVLTIYAAIKIIIIPVSNYLSHYLSRKAAVLITCFIATATLLLSPAISMPYNTNKLYNTRYICEHFIEKKHNDELLTGQINFKQRVMLCELHLKDQ